MATSRRIQGITIEIGGDTVKLQDALKKVNDRLNETGRDLKDVDRLLKMDPGNVDLLRQKQDLLTRSIQDTKEKLRQEQEALAQLRDAPQTEKTIEQQQRLTREVADTEQALKKLEDQYRDFGSVASQQVAAVGDKMQAVGGKISGAGEAIAPLSAAAAGGLGAAVKMASDFDTAMSQVAATMGRTTEEIDSEVVTVQTSWGAFTGTLRDFARKAGAETAFSATEAAEALNYMALAGYDTETSIKMLPNVLDLAAAGDLALASASDMVTDAQSALGLSLDETTELVDKMARTASSSNTSVAQLGAAILTVGGTAKTLKGGTTELSTALGILADNGIKGSEGGTALRNILLSLSAPTDKAAALMEDLGLRVFDAQGDMRPLNEIFGDFNGILSSMTQAEKTNVLDAIFNKVDLKSVTALLANTADGIENISLALEESGIAWEKYEDKAWMANGGISGLVDEMIWNLKEAGTTAEELQEYLRFEYALDADDALAVVDLVSGALEENGTRWDELSGKIDDAEGAAKAMADEILNNLDGDLKLLTSALSELAISLGELLIPLVRELVDWIRGIVDGLNGLDDGTKKTIVTVGAVIAVLGPLLIVIGKIISSVGTILGLIPKLQSMMTLAGTGAKALFAIVSANPIAAVILGITALISAIVLLYDKFEWFRALVRPIVDWFKSVGDTIAGVAGKIFGTAASAGGGGGTFSSSGRVTSFASGYNNAMILTRPTIFGRSASGSLLLGGDGDGQEAVVGTRLLGDMIESRVGAALAARSGVSQGDIIIPVSIGGAALERIVVRAAQIDTYRRGR